MQAFVQPLLKAPCILIELLSAGDATKIEAQFFYKRSDLLGMLCYVANSSLFLVLVHSFRFQVSGFTGFAFGCHSFSVGSCARLWPWSLAYANCRFFGFASLRLFPR
jgi:hypothetical protein